MAAGAWPHSSCYPSQNLKFGLWDVLMDIGMDNDDYLLVEAIALGCAPVQGSNDR